MIELSCLHGSERYAACFDEVVARAVRVSQPAVLSVLLAIQLFGIVIPPHISPKEHQKERCGHSRPQRSFITFHGALWNILLSAGFPAMFHMIALEQTFVNMGNFDPVNESTKNSRVKLLQIRVLLHSSDKRLDIGFLLLLLLQVFAQDICH